MDLMEYKKAIEDKEENLPLDDLQEDVPIELHNLIIKGIEKENRNRIRNNIYKKVAKYVAIAAVLLLFTFTLFKELGLQTKGSSNLEGNYSNEAVSKTNKESTKDSYLAGDMNREGMNSFNIFVSRTEDKEIIDYLESKAVKIGDDLYKINTSNYKVFCEMTQRKKIKIEVYNSVKNSEVPDSEKNSGELIIKVIYK